MGSFYFSMKLQIVYKTSVSLTSRTFGDLLKYLNSIRTLALSHLFGCTSPGLQLLMKQVLSVGSNFTAYKHIPERGEIWLKLRINILCFFPPLSEVILVPPIHPGMLGETQSGGLEMETVLETSERDKGGWWSASTSPPLLNIWLYISESDNFWIEFPHKVGIIV